MTAFSATWKDKDVCLKHPELANQSAGFEPSTEGAAGPKSPSNLPTWEQ